MIYTNFACHSLHVFDIFAGDWSVGATLVPIPNTIVKTYSADGTPPERARESRPSPAPLRTPQVTADLGRSLFHTHPSAPGAPSRTFETRDHRADDVPSCNHEVCGRSICIARALIMRPMTASVLASAQTFATVLRMRLPTDADALALCHEHIQINARSRHDVDVLDR